MARRGRKRKQGKRTRSGQLSRAGKPNRPAFDKGTDFAQLKNSVFGTDGTDAIGRAYQMGLLGEHGDELKIAARAIFRAYWPLFGQGRIKSCIAADRGRFGQSTGNPVLEKRREDWIGEIITIRDSYPIEHSRAFDQLVIDINPDSGPLWLDRLVAGNGTQRDRQTLDLALDVLGDIVGLTKSERAASA
jgi:hypothetical protein